MHKFVAPVLCAVMMVGAAALTAGCTAKASISAGAETPKPPPPPAPPPPPKPAVPAPAPPPKTTNFQVEGGALKLPGPVVFETASDKLKPESDEVLQVVKDYLDAKPNLTLLRIEGHTDNDGKAADNQTLSEKRAMSVAHWLTAKGIDCKRLIPVGYGASKPIAGSPTAQTADEKAQNRRTSFVNAGLNGKAIGGLPVEGSGGHVAGDPCK